jgi:hypothetical protein
MAGNRWLAGHGTITITGMPAHLEGLSAATLGRRLAINGDKPLVIKLATTSRERGQVQISVSAGRYVFTSDSSVPCKINGTVTRSGELAEGDQVQIGKDLFRMTVQHEDDHDRLGTQKVSPSGAVPVLGSGQCAVCDSALNGITGSWSDGNRSICPRCVASGVQPDHLPQTGREADVARHDEPASASAPTRPMGSAGPVGKALEATPPHLPASVIETPFAPPVVPGPNERAERTPLRTPILSGTEPTPLSQPIIPAPAAGSPVPAASRRTPPSGVHAAATGKDAPAAPAAGATTSESDRMRHSRRISASRLTAVEPAGSGREGLLSKVGRVFGRRDERYQRLDELQAERIERLAEAGRLVLSPGLGLGLGEAVVAALLQGQRVTLGASDCSTTGLEQWRSLRKRMDLMDAEIAALRHTLGMGPDPTTTLPQSPTLRVDDRRQQERAFAALDGLSTDELGLELSQGATPPPDSAGATPSSGRHRQPRRRR